jgi:2',3'-cyclic-nucleotide 2'-phosphodiesterase (5'-nucleotidase family)/DNA-binding beta-propeller fold protein YncE
MLSLRTAALGAALLPTLAPVAAPAVQAQDVQLDLLGTYRTGIFDGGAAEIVAFDPATARLFFVNADANEVVALDASDPSDLREVFSIGLDAFGGGANAVAVKGGIVAVAVEADEATDDGTVVFFTSKGTFLAAIEAGALPDNLAFSPDGRYVVVANEGEPSGYEDDDLDPEGSITVIDIQNGIAGASVRQVTFEAFNVGGPRNAELGNGLRIFGPGASVAQDLEPEYVAISPDGAKAYVSLQENNGLVIVDLATASVDAIAGLGFKDYSAAGNGIDPSDRDDAISIGQVPAFGIYQPDAIATYEVDGQTYVVTANEGDAREYDGFEEESRVKDLALDPAAFPDAATLQLDENLGRLTVTTTLGDMGDDGDFEALYSFGARSFSIHAADGTRLFDSGDDFEQITADRLGTDFNSDNDENDTGDARSDAKGPEPEAITVGQIGDRFYAFVGLERVGGVMVYDVTDPANATFVDYVNNRDFSVDAQLGDGSPNPAAGDLGPEGIVFISPADSPTGRALLAVSNEVSGTVSVYGVSGGLTLTLLHNNDGESEVLPSEIDGFGEVGGIARFASAVESVRGSTSADGTLLVSSGDNYLAGPEFNASLDAGLYYDAVGLDLIGYDAIALGNHDFDFGPNVLAEFIREFDQTEPPFLSANLDVSGEPALAALEAEGRVAARTVAVVGGQRVGIVGATTPNLPFISSPGNVQVLTDVAGQVQAEIDALESQGIDKIILISHLQGIEEDRALIPMLSGIDVVVAGGGDELLANSPDEVIPGDESEIFGAYPLTAQNADGQTVPVVTTSGQYRYLGRLDVTFDGAGVVTSFGGQPIRIAQADGFSPDAEVEVAVEDPVAAYVADLDNTVIAQSDVPLDGRRSAIRSMETNLGNLITDAFLFVARDRADSFGLDSPDVAIANGGGIRNDDVIAPGPISEGTTFDVLPFGNVLGIVEDVPASAFKALLETAYGRFAAGDGGSGTGRFAQVAGFTVEIDTTRQARQFDGDGAVTFEGDRIRSVTLDDGTEIVRGGVVVPGAPSLDVAIPDFSARGGDQYPLAQFDFATVGITYQRALSEYLTDGLMGQISAADYPEGGEGRITVVQPRPFSFALRLLHNNDGESAVLPDTVDGFGVTGGIARFATAVEEQRAASSADLTLLLSSGDNFLASSTVNASQADGINYDAVGLDLIGYDALALGNHDFDFGPAFLADFIQEFDRTQPPFLSANLVFDAEPALAPLVAQGRIAARTVVGEGESRVGIVGATTPQLPFISSPGNVQVLQDVAREVQIEVDALLAQGVDRIVLIAHLQGLDADLDLVPLLSGVDVVIAGGGDELLANEDTPLLPGDVRSDAGDYPLEVMDADMNVVPVVTTSGQYRYLGRLDVGFDDDGDVVVYEGDPIRIAEADGFEPDEEVQEQVEEPVAQYVADLATTVLAQTDVRLVGLRDSVRTRQASLGSLLADAYLYVGDSLAASFGAPDPDIAFANGGGIRNDVVVEAGEPLTAFDVAEAFPFGNFATLVEGLTPERLKLLFEVAYASLPGSSGGFAQVAGLTVEVDTTRQGLAFVDGSDPLEIDQEGQRVRRITLADGTPIVADYEVVDGAPTVNAVTADFSATNGSDPLFGGDRYPLRDLAFTRLGVTYQQAVVDYVTQALGGQITEDNFEDASTGRIRLIANGVSNEEGAELPAAFALRGAFPNPASHQATLRFDLPTASEVTVSVFDVTGRLVAERSMDAPAGADHKAEIHTGGLAPGLYVYRVSAGQQTATGKLTVVR